MIINPNEKKTVDSSVGFVQGVPVQIRANCSSAGGGWYIDESTALFKGALNTVVIGVQPFVGFVPARSTWESLETMISRKIPKEVLREMSTAQKFEALAQFVVPWVAVHHVPVPYALDAITSQELRSYWPKGKVTQTFFKSFGLTNDQGGFFGPNGLVTRLDNSGLSFLDVITTIGFTETTGDNKFYINSFDFFVPDKDSPDGKHLDACRKFVKDWLKANPDAEEFPTAKVEACWPTTADSILKVDDEFVFGGLQVLKATAVVLLGMEKAKELNWETIRANLIASAKGGFDLQAADQLELPPVTVEAID